MIGDLTFDSLLLAVIFLTAVIGTVLVHLWLSKMGLRMPVVLSRSAYLRLGLLAGAWGSILAIPVMFVSSLLLQQPITLGKVSRVLVEGFVTLAGAAVLAYIIIGVLGTRDRSS